MSATSWPRPPTSGAAAAKRLVLLVAGALLLLVIYGALFTFDVSQYGAVSWFGRIVRVVDTPGLHFKLPFERVLTVERRLLYPSRSRPSISPRTRQT